MILNYIFIDLFTPFVIFIGIGYVLGFITSYMIFKINELEIKNKLLEKRILEVRNDKLKQEKKEEPKKEEEKKEKREVKEEENIIEEEKKENDDDEKKNLNTVEQIIKEEPEPKKNTFKPPEIKERKVVEEPWTVIKYKKYR